MSLNWNQVEAAFSNSASHFEGVVPEQRAQGNPARPGTLHTQSEGLRPEGDQLARKEAIQNKVLSPESPGEDPYISDRERVKSSSSSGDWKEIEFQRFTEES